MHERPFAALTEVPMVIYRGVEIDRRKDRGEAINWRVRG